MPIWDLFSKREARRRGEVTDVVQYDDLPETFRVQVVQILRETLRSWQQADPYGYNPPRPPNDFWAAIFRIMTREKGHFALSERNPKSPPDAQCIDYLLTQPTEDALDLIEVAFVLINGTLRAMDAYERQHYHLGDPDDAINELNARFRQHAIGYEFSGSRIIRVDSQYIHAEAVKPAIELLYGAGKGFSGPLQEFLEAHDKYRKGDHKDAIVAASRAFESTMKAICTARGWPFDPHKDTASSLIKIVFDNGLVPSWMQNQFTALRSVMESGVPTPRNKTSGHGQGATPTKVPDHLVRFTLNLAASNIVFLIESHKTLK
jgi:hypothetical protein